VVLLAAVNSSRSDQACPDGPAPEGAPGYKRGCSCGEQQRHSACAGLAAARIGDDLAARREQLALVGFAYSPA
jgi:hypothetical protein